MKPCTGSVAMLARNGLYTCAAGVVPSGGSWLRMSAFWRAFATPSCICPMALIRAWPPDSLTPTPAATEAEKLAAESLIPRIPAKNASGMTNPLPNAASSYGNK